MLFVGQILQDRYKVTQQLGEGGMGVVYEAIDMRLNSRVAIKESLTLEEDFIRAFRREAQLLANLHHPSLPRVIDHFSEGEAHFLVMDFIEGEDLKALASRYPKGFPVNEVLEWTKQLQEIIEYLHNQPTPILHRDIKPANMKVRNDRIFLLDFGLARGHAGQMTITNLKTSFQGYTPNFAPPEQIQNQGTNQQSDIYSLSATIYKLLTNVNPSDALERVMAMATGKGDTLIDIRRLKPELNENVAKVLMQGLSLDAGARPPSAAWMRQAMFSLDFTAKTSDKTLALNLNQIKEEETVVRDLKDAKPDTVTPNNPPPTRPFIAPTVNQLYNLPPTRQVQIPNGVNPENWNQLPANQYTSSRSNKLPLIIAGILGFFICCLSAGIIIRNLIPPKPVDDGKTDVIRVPPIPPVNKRETAIALTQKAESFLQSGKYDESLQASKAAIEADKDYAPAYEFYGDANWDSQYPNDYKVSEMTEVQKSADKILELVKEPRSAEEFMARSWAYLAKGKNDESLKDAGKANELRPNYAAALMLRAISNKDLKKGLEDYSQVLRLNPNYAQAYANRAGHYHQLKQDTQAISDITEAIRILPAARYYVTRGDYYLDQKKYDDAQKEFEEAIKLDPKSVFAYTGMASILYNQKKWDEALVKYQKALAIKPNALINNSIGNCYYSLKKWDDALRSYTEAIRFDAGRAVYYENRAGVYRNTGKNELAKSDEAEAKRLKQNDPKQ